MDLALVSGSSSAGLAMEIARELGEGVSACTVERFPDGEAHVHIAGVEDADLYVVQATGPPVDEHLMELLLLADASRRAGAGRVTAVIPYFGYARQDRRARRGEALGARLVGDLLSTAGIDRAIVLDPHSDAFEGLCSVPVEIVSARQSLAEAVRPEVRGQAVVVAPDEGALKLAQQFAAELGLGLAVVAKRRLSGELVSVEEVVGDVRGRSVIVVDDMISTAATIAAAVGALLDRDALADFVVAAVHGLFVGAATDRLRELPIRRLFVTDSLPLRSGVPGATSVVSVARLLADHIAQLHGDHVRSAESPAPAAL
jgi:ribose-phosphate pyrophosphokinase